jgi:hypothetical protein
MNEKVVDIKSRISKTMEIEAKEILANLSPDKIRAISEYITGKFTEDVRRGLIGELSYKDSPFFALIDGLYRDYDDPKAQPHGCYFCDSNIDGNATPFDFPNTKLCLSCMVKVANILAAFNIDPHCIFPGMAARKVQPVLFKEEVRLLMPSRS